MNRHFCKEVIQMANKHPKKMLTIVNHQEDAKENYNEITPHTDNHGGHKKFF